MLKLKHLSDRLERTPAYLSEVEKSSHAGSARNKGLVAGLKLQVSVDR